jgi:DNA-binding NarL/FixJ family response regulator
MEMIQFMPSITPLGEGVTVGDKLPLPQVAEMHTPQPVDVAGECLLYDKNMTRVYIADARSDERSALRLLLLDLKMDVIGEAADWLTTLAQAPLRRTDMLLVDWDLLPSEPSVAVEGLRKACPAALVIVLISHLDARQQAVILAGVDAFISKGEMPERVAERLRTVAASPPPRRANIPVG